MIRHQYTNCTSCHVDPSGGGLLTPYGQAQHDLLVTATYGKSPENIQPKVVPFPDGLNAGFSFRGALLDYDVPSASSPGAAPLPNGLQAILMILELRGELSAGPLHAVATLGFQPMGANLAALTSASQDNLVSREHYLGLDLLDQAIMVRAGRMNVPFGLRIPEHPAWVRSETRTDIDSYQQYGVAVAYNTSGFRSELMGIAGNYLIRQPDYREHGYAGYAELAFTPTFTLGVSSLLTQAAKGLYTSEPDTLRQAHGAFLRWAVVEPVVILGEVDALIEKSQITATWVGYASFLQADYEPFQGVHFLLTGESLSERGQAGIGGWASVAYFFYSFAELRVDSIWRRYETPQGAVPTLTVLGQLHVSM
jgi:hypothetical protein